MGAVCRFIFCWIPEAAFSPDLPCANTVGGTASTRGRAARGRPVCTTRAGGGEPREASGGGTGYGGGSVARRLRVPCGGLTRKRASRTVCRGLSSIGQSHGTRATRPGRLIPRPHTPVGANTRARDQFPPLSLSRDAPPPGRRSPHPPQEARASRAPAPAASADPRHLQAAAHRGSAVGASEQRAHERRRTHYQRLRLAPLATARER